jgi:hypothetical protein
MFPACTKGPDWLWSPSSQLSNEHSGFYRERSGRGVEPTILFRLASSSLQYAFTACAGSTAYCTLQLAPTSFSRTNNPHRQNGSQSGGCSASKRRSRTTPTIPHLCKGALRLRGSAVARWLGLSVRIPPGHGYLLCSSVPRNFFGGGGSNSAEDRGQREWGSGCSSPLVRGFTQFVNERNPYSD